MIVNNSDSDSLDQFIRDKSEYLKKWCYFRFISEYLEYNKVDELCDRTALINDEVIRRDICWRREYSINTNHSHFTQIIIVSVSCHYASFLYLSIIGTDSNKGNVWLYLIHSLWDCWRVWIESIIHGTHMTEYGEDEW